MNGQWDVVVQSVIERWKLFLLVGSLRKESFCKHLLHWLYILYCTIKRLTTWVFPTSKRCQVLKTFLWKVHTTLRSLQSWYNPLHSISFQHCKKYRTNDLSSWHRGYLSLHGCYFEHYLANSDIFWYWDILRFWITQ